MLFREFNIIAAAAYAAECAADPARHHGVRAQWDELEQDAQNLQRDLVMAIARGEEPVLVSPVFIATTKAILGFNGGQGGLALEDLANLGGLVLNLDLLTEDQVAGLSIRETIEELLYELQQYRQGGGGVEAAEVADSQRLSALALAVDLFQQCQDAGRKTEPIVDIAAKFAAFIEQPAAAAWMRNNALTNAVRVAEPGMRAATVLLVAEDFMQFLEPLAAADPEPQGGVEVAEQEAATVQ